MIFLPYLWLRGIKLLIFWLSKSINAKAFLKHTIIRGIKLLRFRLSKNIHAKAKLICPYLRSSITFMYRRCSLSWTLLRVTGLRKDSFFLDLNRVWPASSPKASSSLAEIRRLFPHLLNKSQSHLMKRSGYAIKFMGGWTLNPICMKRNRRHAFDSFHWTFADWFTVEKKEQTIFFKEGSIKSELTY